MKKLLITIFFLFAIESIYSQTNDSVNTKFILYSSGIYATSLVGLGYAWYGQFEHSRFHFFNDGPEWLQMDKFGHSFSAFHINRILHNNIHDKNLLLSAGITQIYMGGIEILDALQSDWGFSTWDMIANLSGSSLFIIKEKYKLPINVKFSFYPTGYADKNPSLLGKTFIEQIIKDYNSQTYWLSVDISKKSIFTIDIGYSADGMIGGRENQGKYSNIDRVRQFYISAGIDFKKIKTQSKLLRQVLNILNIIKIPFPAVEINSKGILLFHPVYF
jgi:hypothetical protein